MTDYVYLVMGVIPFEEETVCYVSSNIENAIEKIEEFSKYAPMNYYGYFDIEKHYIDSDKDSEECKSFKKTFKDGKRVFEEVKE